MCAVQYFPRNMDWSHVDSDVQRIQFGVSGGNPVTPILTAADGSLDGAQSLISLSSMVLPPRLGATQRRRWSYATACEQRARRLTIFGHPQPNDESLVCRLMGGDFPLGFPRKTGAHEYHGKIFMCGALSMAADRGTRQHELKRLAVRATDASHQFAYGQLRLRGPGCDGVEPTRCTIAQTGRNMSFKPS